MGMEEQLEAFCAKMRVKESLRNGDYRDARDLMRMSSELYPQQKDGLKILVLCETLYNGHFGRDWYSVLQLESSDTLAKVNDRCTLLTTLLSDLDFPRTSEALLLIKEAKYILNKANHTDLDYEEEYSELVNMEDSSENTSFMAYSAKRSQCTVDGEFCLSPEPRKLENQIMPQTHRHPHHHPLNKYGSKVREGMMIGLDIAFANIAEEIMKLEGVESFWSNLDDFMEQLAQLEEMGYNVQKLRERLVYLKKIAERYQDSEDALKRSEGDVMDLQSRILDLQVQLNKQICTMDTLKKDLRNVAYEFELEAKSKLTEA